MPNRYAESRMTHTPILIRDEGPKPMAMGLLGDLLPKVVASYNPTSHPYLQSIYGDPVESADLLKGQMRSQGRDSLSDPDNYGMIESYGQPDPGSIRHEEVHALMDRMRRGGMDPQIGSDPASQRAMQNYSYSARDLPEEVLARDVEGTLPGGSGALDLATRMRRYIRGYDPATSQLLDRMTRR